MGLMTKWRLSGWKRGEKSVLERLGCQVTSLKEYRNQMTNLKTINILILTLFCFSTYLLPSFAEKNTPPGLSKQVLKSASELDYPPFALVRDNGTADGFSVDLLKAVVKTMGKDIHFIDHSR